MRVLMRGERLHKAGAFKRALRLPEIEQSGALKHPVGNRWAHRHDVAIKHHEGEPAIALQRELMVEVNDGILFPLLEPVITGNEDVVFVGLTIAISPLVIFGAEELHAVQQAQRADLGARREPLDEVDDIVTGVVSNPASAQLSPSSFFVRTSSSTTSASLMRWRIEDCSRLVS